MINFDSGGAKRICKKLGHNYRSYFLNVCLSSVMPSSVFITASLRASMHSFSRGSPVRSPVSLSAYKLNSVSKVSKYSQTFEEMPARDE